MISIIIVNYNMPEDTDSLVEFLNNRVHVDYKLHVVDNGSDEEFISKYTTTRLDANRNKLGGVLTGMYMASKDNPDVYWMISTNMQFRFFLGDPAEILRTALFSVDNAVGIQAGFVGETQDWTHKAVEMRDESIYHVLDGGLGPYAMYKADWLDYIGWFDPCLTSSWGTDFEMGYLCRKHGKILLVHDVVTYNVRKGGVFRENRAKETLGSYQTSCREEMNGVLSRKYGPDWERILGIHGH